VQDSEAEEWKSERKGSRAAKKEIDTRSANDANSFPKKFSKSQQQTP
jgi:hypothetical protein